MLILFIINAGYLVDMPNSYIPEKGTYEISMTITPENSFIAQISGVLLENFSIGTSYGGSGIIGHGTPTYHKTPGVQVKMGMQKQPISASIGFDSEQYYDEPVWLYGVIGGNLMGRIIPCIGVNYYKHLNGFCGVEAGLSNLASVAGEWLVSKGDTNKYVSTINLGLRLKVEDKVTFEIFFKDISNKEIGVSRGVRFSYSAFI
ncbi:MAG: hypothetical protein PHE49_00520 [bacterium]|nr:hypothetical protein [bacterium]